MAGLGAVWPGESGTVEDSGEVSPAPLYTVPLEAVKLEDYDVFAIVLMEKTADGFNMITKKL